MVVSTFDFVPAVGAVLSLGLVGVVLSFPMLGSLPGVLPGSLAVSFPTDPVPFEDLLPGDGASLANPFAIPGGDCGFIVPNAVKGEASLISFCTFFRWPAKITHVDQQSSRKCGELTRWPGPLHPFCFDKLEHGEGDHDHEYGSEDTRTGVQADFVSRS